MTTKAITPNQERLAKQKYEQIRKAAYKAFLARDRLERILDKAQANRKAWERMCQVTGVSVDCDTGDWMC